MSIYISGMDMPTDSTAITIHKIGGKLYAKRYLADSLHPIIPIPDHGDLISRDALREEVKKHAAPSDAWVFSLIRTAPTIIPADKEEN